MVRALVLPALLAIGCGGPGEACDPGLDDDDDGLDECAELELGTDPDKSDSDDDGFDDDDELNCLSDPLDADEVCYACGWRHSDPGDLASTGDDEGDVIENLVFVDQCGEDVDLWDFAGKYHVLWMTAAW